MKNDKSHIVVGIGEILWDMLPEGRKLGGAPANFAYHVSQLGLCSKIVSAVGYDTSGYDILNTLREKGLDTDFIERIDKPTGTVEISITGKGIPEYDIKDNVAWDNIPFTDNLTELAAKTKAVAFGSLAQRHHVSARTINAFLDAIPEENGALKIFDINLRQDFYDKNTIERSLHKCNILKLNDEEIDIICRMIGISGTIEQIVNTIRKTYSIDILVLTCGTKGSYVFGQDTMSFLPTPKVKTADTVGAGDSFTAAFTASILLGKSIEEAHKAAVDVSAFVCTQYGAMPALPDTIWR
ncbi:carbohydrate kinase [Muribaculum sp. An289]|uniref:Carbohydrate kinase n=1 Tax=Candidatus Merdivivens faecigallinarum TaxID=2840871 RepID=A0A9D9J1Q0_9BACT|nr:MULTISPECIES: carbohydrate kinase [unclassified Muribaculum]MBO8482181.1 carbohydrate kinase [Candidatus Merdivivens faecigallinarum]OUO36043.1 carbohydrate kinase [Muribaculum sp. An289]OUO40719.1 carbohydrate kinase [Muribaculum sp. An287]